MTLTTALHNSLLCSAVSFAQEVPGEEAVKTTEAAPAESAPTGEAQKPAS
jgi:hypothetical protein